MSAPDAELEQWIRTFRGPLIGLLASWGVGWARAEELAQDTFAEAWLSRSRFRGSSGDLGQVGAWLRGIAFRLHAAGARRERRRAATPIGQVDPAAPTTQPEDARLARLEEAIARLPAPQQTVIRMRYLEDSPAQDVAALLGLTRKALERRLYRARRALREHLQREQTEVNR